MNDYNGLREGLHGGSELVQLNGMVTVSTVISNFMACLLYMPPLTPSHTSFASSVLAPFICWPHSAAQCCKLQPSIITMSPT